MSEKFDAIVVGAGPSGNAAAYTLAKAGLSVLQLERGEYPGSKNVQGAILYAHALEKIIPDFRTSAPLERPVVEQRMWLLDEGQSYLGANYRHEDFGKEPGRYTIVRAKFDKWFSGKVQEAGALLICETTVKELLRDEAGKVIGVRTEREDGEIFADVVVLADGVNSLLAQKAGFRKDILPEHAALAVKETLFLPKDQIEARFNVPANQGVVIEIAGAITEGMLGTGFLYTNKDSLSIGIGCILSDMRTRQLTPYALLERLKRHPAIKPLIAGAEMKEYAAHLIPEGGYKGVPRLYGDGWMIVGDSGGFVNAVHREGSNLAMTTGRLAAETIIGLKAAGKPASSANLAAYKAAVDESFVMKDLEKYKEAPDMLLANPHFLTAYPALLGQAAKTMLTVDGEPKRDKQKQIWQSFKEKRSFWGLIGDAYKFWRAFK